MDNQILAQDNALTSSRHEYTSLEKNIMYSVMGELRKSDIETGKKFYHVSIRDLQDKTGVESRYVDYKNAIDRMIDKSFKIQKENGNYLHVNLFSSAEYLAGTGVIEVELSEKIKPYLLELKSNFTTFQLEMALTLRSKFSKRLYEMLSQYKDTGFMNLEINELKSRLGLISNDGTVQYEKWSAFERYVMKVAQKEINKVTDITFNYKPKKQGRSFTDIDFFITHEPYQVIIDFKDQKTEIFSRLINKFGLNKLQAQKVIEKHDEKHINKTLYKIQTGVRDGAIKNVGAYTAKTLGV